jgi:uncharacterized phiE125 gp8 family phage protein
MASYVVVTPPSVEPVSLSEVMKYCRIDESNQEPPPGIFNVALGVGAGSVTNGVHRYLATFVTPEGETQSGLSSALVNVIDRTVNGIVNLSAIPIGGATVIARKIYRTKAGGSTYFLVATIADNTTTTYSDNVGDGSISVQAPILNTTSDPMITLLIKSARLKAESLLCRYLITQTVDLYLDGFPDSEIKLPPLQSVTWISYVDSNGAEQVIAADQYIIDTASVPARITPAFGLEWPEARQQLNSVKIRFVAGYGNASQIPENIKNWILMRVKQNFDQRDAVNVGNIVSEFPHSYVDGLLDSERIYGY